MGVTRLKGLPVITRDMKVKYEGKATSQLKKWSQRATRNQIVLSNSMLTLFFLTHTCFPGVRQYTRKFVVLSYYNPNSGEYSKGWDDAWMVLFWVVLFTGLRATMMQYILMPIAQMGGVKIQKKQVRFAEQAWLLIYCSVFWTLGMYIWTNSDYWLNMNELWTNWPSREIGGLQKWYIVVQYAFWLQQILVINLEERRKDYWQMLCHHIVTTTLLFTSYAYHQTKVDNVILCATDIVDILFPLAKCLKYLGYTTIVDILFGVFMITWIASRHILYVMICYSVWVDLPANIAYGCYKGKHLALTGPFPAPNCVLHLLEPFHNPEGIVCFSHKIKWAFLSLLLLLQGIMFMWFCMILKVAVRVVRGGQAEEIRSDDEDCEDTPDHKQVIQASNQAAVSQYREGVNSDAIDLQCQSAYSISKKYKRSKHKTSDISLLARKELLYRVRYNKANQDT